MPIDPPSTFCDDQKIKIVANELSERFTYLVDHHIVKDEVTEEPKPATHEVTGVSYLADTGYDTIDLVGEPSIKTFFQGMRKNE